VKSNRRNEKEKQKGRENNTIDNGPYVLHARPMDSTCTPFRHKRIYNNLE
jgi:hypothetical protein